MEYSFKMKSGEVYVLKLHMPFPLLVQTLQTMAVTNKLFIFHTPQNIIINVLEIESIEPYRG